MQKPVFLPPIKPQIANFFTNESTRVMGIYIGHLKREVKACIEYELDEDQTRYHLAKIQIPACKKWEGEPLERDEMLKLYNKHWHKIVKQELINYAINTYYHNADRDIDNV